MSKAHEIVRTGLTFAEFFRRFPDDTAAEAWFESRRWPNGPQCPHCDSDRITAVKSRRPMPYRCKDCRKHFSVTSHTVMHQSKLGCQTWLLALFLIVSNPKGRSSVQLAADLGVTQKTAWHLAHRIRIALTEGGMAGFGGPVEADETYIGGKAKNMHNRRRKHVKPALRILAGSDGVEEGPVGFAGVEQRPDPVVGESSEPEGGAFDALV